MNRLFGAKSAAPKPTLNSAISNVETRISSIDVKLAALTTELTGLQTRLSRLPPNSPARRPLRTKALATLQRRKQYESQRAQLQSQCYNMEAANDMTDNLKNVMTTVDAMKTTQKQLTKQYGKIDVDKIERMQDEMQELMEVGNEIQESLGRSYDVPEDVDEEELDAELEALAMEGEMMGGMEGLGAEGLGTPGFMLDEVRAPEFIDEAPEMGGKVKEVAR